MILKIEIKENLEDIPDGWDQFDLNEKKYKISSNYEEVLYTTKLNKDNLTEEEKIKAEKIMKVNKLKNIFFKGNSIG